MFNRGENRCLQTFGPESFQYSSVLGKSIEKIVSLCDHNNDEQEHCTRTNPDPASSVQWLLHLWSQSRVTLDRVLCVHFVDERKSEKLENRPGPECPVWVRGPGAERVCVTPLPSRESPDVQRFGGVLGWLRHRRASL